MKKIVFALFLIACSGSNEPPIDVLLAFILGGFIGSAVMYFALGRDLSTQTDTYQEGLRQIAEAIEDVPTLPEACASCGGEWRDAAMLAHKDAARARLNGGK